MTNTYTKKHKHFNQYFIVILTILSFCFSSYLYANKSTNELIAPDIEVISIELLMIDFNGAKLAIVFSVSNTNNQYIDVESIRYNIKLNNVPALNGQIKQAANFPENTIRRINVPVEIPYNENFPAILNVLSNPTSSYYEITGSIVLKNEKNSIPFYHNGNIPLPQLSMR